MPHEESVPVGKPKGGYQLIPVVQLALAWWCYHERIIRLVDLRVWFAAWEMRARRCRRPAPLPGRFGLEELGRLTGLSARRLVDALRRLEAARLLNWSQSAVEFPALPGTVPLPDRVAFARFFDQIPNHGRRVPMPRRTLRLLAGGARPALIATILGHLLRCLYLRQGKCSARGRVKASWIADTFGVGLRRVKEARRQLITMGWLIPLAADQWTLNRWGAHVRINLDWSRTGAIESHPDAVGQDSELAPPAPISGPELAPPESDDKPLAGCKNQEPALGGPAGVFTIEQAEKAVQSADTVQSVATAESPPPAPLGSYAETPQGAKADLRHVLLEDLRDTGRLLELYMQAVSLGLAAASEWGRLRFVAAAEHARVIGTKNPCGLFVRLVRGGLWHFATGDDEAAASVRLRRHLHGQTMARQVEPGAGCRRTSDLSADAQLVQAVRAVAAQQRLRGDPFPLLLHQKPDWTRERWDNAVAELDASTGASR
jgi:hypothetical protein